MSWMLDAGWTRLYGNLFVRGDKVTRDWQLRSLGDSANKYSTSIHPSIHLSIHPISPKTESMSEIRGFGTVVTCIEDFDRNLLFSPLSLSVHLKEATQILRKRSGRAPV